MVIRGISEAATKFKKLKKRKHQEKHKKVWMVSSSLKCSSESHKLTCFVVGPITLEEYQELRQSGGVHGLKLCRGPLIYPMMLRLKD